MKRDESRLSGQIVRLMHKGVYLKQRDGELQIVGTRTSIGELDEEDIALLNIKKDEILRLMIPNSQELDEDNSSERVIGRFLAKHLVNFWRKVDSGIFDIFFTNLTHSMSRLPRRIDSGQFLQAAQLIIDRHLVLRLTLTSEGREMYRLGLSDFSEMDIRVEEGPDRVSYARMEARASELISEKLDNRKGMVRLFLLQNEDCSLLGVVINHFVSDLKSVASITSEIIAACYGRQIAHSQRSICEEGEFIREISDIYDYSSDS